VYDSVIVCNFLLVGVAKRALDDFERTREPPRRGRKGVRETTTLSLFPVDRAALPAAFPVRMSAVFMTNGHCSCGFSMDGRLNDDVREQLASWLDEHGSLALAFFATRGDPCDDIPRMVTAPRTLDLGGALFATKEPVILHVIR
jgi:hypothetical protein